MPCTSNPFSFLPLIDDNDPRWPPCPKKHKKVVHRHSPVTKPTAPAVPTVVASTAMPAPVTVEVPKRGDDPPRPPLDIPSPVATTIAVTTTAIPIKPPDLYDPRSLEIFILVLLCVLAVAAVVYAVRAAIYLFEQAVIAEVDVRRAYHHAVERVKLFVETIRYLYWSRFSDQQLSQILNSINDTILASIDRASKLHDQADRYQNRRYLPKLIRWRAARWTDNAASIQDYLVKMKTYFDRIIHDRQAKVAAALISRVTQLISTIASPDDAKATAALAELYTLRNQIDWDTLIPPHVTNNDRVTVEKAYRQMSGTTSLNEARTAWSYIQRMTGQTT